MASQAFDDDDLPCTQPSAADAGFQLDNITERFGVGDNDADVQPAEDEVSDEEDEGVEEEDKEDTLSCGACHLAHGRKFELIDIVISPGETVCTQCLHHASEENIEKGAIIQHVSTESARDAFYSKLATKLAIRETSEVHMDAVDAVQKQMLILESVGKYKKFLLNNVSTMSEDMGSPRTPVSVRSGVSSAGSADRAAGTSIWERTVSELLSDAVPVRCRDDVLGARPAPPARRTSGRGKGKGRGKSGEPKELKLLTKSDKELMRFASDFSKESWMTKLKGKVYSATNYPAKVADAKTLLQGTTFADRIPDIENLEVVSLAIAEIVKMTQDEGMTVHNCDKVLLHIDHLDTYLSGHSLPLAPSLKLQQVTPVG